MICAASLLLFTVGASFAVLLGNYFLVPVMAAGMMFVPFWYVRLTQSHFKKDIAAELENLVFEPRKEFIIMQILVIGNIPLMYFLNRDWYETLMYTTVGQIILAVCAAVIFISTAFVIKLTQPIEYRR